MLEWAVTSFLLIASLCASYAGYRLIIDQIAASAADALVINPPVNHLLLAFIGVFIFVIGIFFSLFMLFVINKLVNEKGKKTE